MLLKFSKPFQFIELTLQHKQNRYKLLNYRFCDKNKPLQPVNRACSKKNLENLDIIIISNVNGGKSNSYKRNESNPLIYKV